MITPFGFYFRQRTLDSVEHVISAFKTKPNFKKEQAAQQQRQAAPGLDASAAAGGYVAQVPGYPGGYPVAPSAGYGYGVQQQQYRPAGGYQGAPPAAAAAGYGQPGGGYGYAQGGYQQQGYPQQQQQYQQGYGYGR